jgi:hypothetical protein
MRVKLTNKLAEKMEGVDLSLYADGDVIDLSHADALLLIRGGWAEPVRANEERIAAIPRQRGNVAADGS